MLNQVVREGGCCECSPVKKPNVAQMLMGSTQTLVEIHTHADDLLRVVSGGCTSDASESSANCMLQEAVNLEESLRALRDKLLMLKQFLWDC